MIVQVQSCRVAEAQKCICAHYVQRCKCRGAEVQRCRAAKVQLQRCKGADMKVQMS